MIASRFTKAFQLISLALVFSLAQLYVLAVPTRANTDPKADKSSISQPKAEASVINPGDQTASATTAPSAAGERMPLTAGTKIMLTRIFSKNNVEARIAAGNTFLNTKTSSAGMFKAPRMNLAPAQDDGDDDGDDSKGAWIVVGVIAAVVTIAVIGLRMDRNREN